MDYIKKYRQMISLRNLSDHTMMSYMTYIKTYLEYLDSINKFPSQIKPSDLQNYVSWLKTTRNLSDCTINCAIAQVRFFTPYVLRKPWCCSAH